MIDNGYRGHLIIPGVFDGEAGVQGRKVSFKPNRFEKRPHLVRVGALDGKGVILDTTKDEIGPFWTSRFEEIA